jgi:hypothetical protein
VRLDLEWRIPWPAEWDGDKKTKAAERLAEYMRTGTFYETQRRMRVVEARVEKLEAQPSRAVPTNEPYLVLVLE